MASGWRLWTALWIVYLVWGSTYVAIKVSVRTMPPFLSAGGRFILAGLILGVIVIALGRSLRVPLREAVSAGALGIALLTLGVGLVTLAETRIDSGIAAMMAGSVPLQVIVLRTLARDRVAIVTRVSAVVGLAGLALIVVPEGVGGGSIGVGLGIMLIATASWSAGSFLSHKLSLPADAFVATTYEMLTAGAVLLVMAFLHSESFASIDEMSGTSLLAWLYLAVVGSLVGFSAYAWLLRSAPISQVVTHQYVNPIVAIGLGALLLGEHLSVTTAIGALIVVSSVFVTVRRESSKAVAEI